MKEKQEENCIKPQIVKVDDENPVNTVKIKLLNLVMNRVNKKVKGEISAKLDEKVEKSKELREELKD